MLGNRSKDLYFATFEKRKKLINFIAIFSNFSWQIIYNLCINLCSKMKYANYLQQIYCKIFVFEHHTNAVRIYATNFEDWIEKQTKCNFDVWMQYFIGCLMFINIAFCFLRMPIFIKLSHDLLLLTNCWVVSITHNLKQHFPRHWYPCHCSSVNHLLMA